jgi:hypothetical protein
VRLAVYRRALMTASLVSLLMLGASSTVPVPAQAAPGPVFVQASVGPKVSAGRLTVARPEGTAAGDVLIAGVAEHEVGQITAPAGWTLIRHDEVDRDVWLWVWYRVAGAAEPPSYVWQVPDKAANGAILAYRGVDTAQPVVASTGQVNAGNSTSSIRVPSMDVGFVSHTMLVMFATVEGPTPNNITPPAGFTERTERAVHPSTESSEMLFTGTGATGAKTAKAKAAASGVGVIVALRPRP